MSGTAGLLGDSATRDYARKLQLFNASAAPELRSAIASLGLAPGIRVLDAGCGTGEALRWLGDEVGAGGMVVGIDLATAHLAAARAHAAPEHLVAQADVQKPPLFPGSFDLVWSVNTVNHLREPERGVRTLATLLRSGGALALGQSGFLPDMVFAWDARLEHAVTAAVRRYYRERYRVSEQDLTAVRALLGLLRAAELRNVTVRTFPIERITPLAPADEAYLLEAVFHGTWGERLRPYLSAEDYSQLRRLCDAQCDEYALRRPDFHFLQTFTLAVGYR